MAVNRCTLLSKQKFQYNFAAIRTVLMTFSFRIHRNKTISLSSVYKKHDTIPPGYVILLYSVRGENHIIPHICPPLHND